VTLPRSKPGRKDVARPRALVALGACAAAVALFCVAPWAAASPKVTPKNSFNGFVFSGALSGKLSVTPAACSIDIRAATPPKISVIFTWENATLRGADGGTGLQSLQVGVAQFGTTKFSNASANSRAKINVNVITSNGDTFETGTGTATVGKGANTGTVFATMPPNAPYEGKKALIVTGSWNCLR